MAAREKDLRYLLDADELFLHDSSRNPSPGDIVPCLLCAKPFIMPMYVGDCDQTCPSCQKLYADCAVVVCRVCRSAVCRMKPGLLDSGYYVQPRALLHTDACNICRPGLLKSSVLEIALWERTQRRGKLILPPRFRGRE